MKSFTAAAAIAALLSSTAALAQTNTPTVNPPEPEDTVFDDNYISIGVGAGLGPSYDGSDDYVVFPAPILQGQLGGIGISPRSAGLALDFIQDGEGMGIDAGIAVRLRRNRASQIKDDVVEAAGKLDTALEVGPTVGISFPGLLNPYDSLSIGTDVRWDVLGAHDGMVIEPSVAYFTPLSRAMAASLSFSATYADADFQDYYYSVSPAQSAASGLPQFQTDGGAINKIGSSLLLGYDLDGNLQNGGFALIAVGGYSRMLGDAKDTPYTSIRGSADQFFGALGIGYTF